MASVQLFNDYDQEAAQIARRRKIAEALQAQSNTPIDGNQTAGGWVIPVSPYAGMAKMLQGFSAGAAANKADADEKALSQRYKDDLAKTLAQGNKLAMGSPEMMAQPPATPVDDNGNPNPVVAGTPAQAADPMGAATAYMQHPATMPLGMAAMQKELENQARQRKMADALRMGGNAPNGATAAGAPGGAAFGAGIPPQIMALMTSGDSELAKLGTTLLEANKGIAQRPGAPVVNPFTGQVIAQPTPSVPAGVQLTVGQNGPTAAPVPGAQSAMADIARALSGAQESGKAPFQLETVNTEGAPTLMTREQAITAATGRPMATPGTQPQSRMPAGAPVTAPNLNAGRLQILQEELKNPQNTPQDNIAIQAEIAKIQPTTPGLRLQDQSVSAEQKSFGTERGQLEAAKPQAAIQARTTLTNLERLNNVATELQNHPGLSGITGKVNQYSALDMQPETRAARGLQDTLVKQAAVSTLQAMRDASKTGGAVGAVTEKEWPILEQQLAALNGAQSTPDYQVALKNLQNQMQGAMGRIRSAYQETYKEPLKFESVPYVPQGRSKSGPIGRRATDAQSDIRTQADAILNGNR